MRLSRFPKRLELEFSVEFWGFIYKLIIKYMRRCVRLHVLLFYCAHCVRLSKRIVTKYNYVVHGLDIGLSD